MAITDKEKIEAVTSQLNLFTMEIDRLRRQGRLTPEQDKASIKIVNALNAVIEDYSARSLQQSSN